LFNRKQAMTLICHALALALVAASNAAPVLVQPVKDHGVQKLMLLVPGGKVPPTDYLPMVKAAQKTSDLGLAVAIIQCHINLCDPIFELPGLMKKAIATASKTWGVAFNNSDIFIAGHSLGGVGARHFYDGFKGAAGLALFGTQYNGDHEDYKGTLGYPIDLARFPGPLLALTGELDFTPTSHTADLVRQAKVFSEKDQLLKLPIIVPGMDHSQFCVPFQVKGDLKPEITNDEATATIGTILGSWLDNVAGVSADAASVLQGWIEKTAPIAAPFIAASQADKTWCADAQMLLAGSPPHLQVSLQEVFGSTELEHAHTKGKMNGGDLEATDIFRVYYPSDSIVPSLLPMYQGANDISCKMLSEDKIATMLNLTMPDMSSADVKNKCRLINQKALEKAKDLVKASHPKSLQRFEQQGKKITFEEDSQTSIGPQWLLKGLSVKEESNEITIQSAALISSISSKIYPGNHYCKLLAPSRAVEIVMTTALTQKYTSVAAQIIV